jgi:hypothetical protein
VAKRNYSVEKIVNLIYNPQPQNWPDYATEMPPDAAGAEGRCPQDCHVDSLVEIGR